MPFQTWVARFVVDHGRVTEEGGLLRTFARRRLDEQDVDLHILAEPTGAKGPDLGAQAVENIGKLFMEDRLSLTGGVMRALRTTHTTLLDWNRRSIPREQVTTGVTAALVSGTTVYLFQAGPNLCFGMHNGKLERLLLDPQNEPPLGEGDLDPMLRRIELGPGDLILAASESLLDVIDEASLETMLQKGTDDALPELYLMTKELPSFVLMAITCLEGEGSDEPEQAAVPEPESQYDFVAPSGSVTSRRAVAVQPPPKPAPPPQAVSTPARPPLAVQPGLAGMEVEDLSQREAPDFFAEKEPEPEPQTPILVTPPPVDISRSVVKVRGDGSIGRSNYARTTGASGFRLDVSQGRLLAIAGAVAVVLFVGAFAVPDLIKENRGEKIATLLQSAQVQLQAGAAEADADRRRDLFEDASRLSTEVLRLDDQHIEAASIRTQAQAGLAQLNAVSELGPMTTVTTLSRQVTGEVSLDSMVVAAGNAYLLDSKGGRVIAVPLVGGGAPTTVFQTGQTYGGTPAKEPEFLTWEGTDAAGRLLILDGERKLFALRAGSQPQPLPLRRTNTWNSVAGIAAYDGNFYVLDPNANQVHRYLEAASGFDSEPTNALSGQVSLKDAIGLAVDGDIFVLKRTGPVLRFTQGAAAEFKLAGIDRDLTGPNAIKVVSATSEVFVADSGNKRVVVAGKDGMFKRQLTSSAFTDIRAMAVEPSTGTLFVVVGDAVLSAPIVR